MCPLAIRAACFAEGAYLGISIFDRISGSASCPLLTLQFRVRSADAFGIQLAARLDLGRNALARRLLNRTDRACAVTPVAGLGNHGVNERLGGCEAGIGVVFLGSVFQEQRRKPLLMRRMPRGEDWSFQRANRALKLRRRLLSDLHTERGTDLAHPLKRGLFLGDDGIDLTDAELV